jgi:hypothetical protein
MHAATYNTFAVARHLTTARTHRLFRTEAFGEWRDAVGGACVKVTKIALSAATMHNVTRPM